MSEDDVDETERLRTLVGPSEVSYEVALRDLSEAQGAAREAVAEAGALRGEIVELRLEADRARQRLHTLDLERAETEHAARAAEHLQLQVDELNTRLTRALDDRELLLQRAAMRPTRRIYDQVRGRWRTVVAPRLERFTGRSN